MEQIADGSRIWLPGIVECIARWLPKNEVACVLSLVNKATSQQFADRKTLHLSLPSPTHVFSPRWGSPDAFRGFSYEQRRTFLCLTVSNGSIANLEVALANAGLLLDDELLETAAAAGRLEACKWLRERGCPWGDSLAEAARGGHWHVCEWLLASGCPCLLGDVYEAARGGHEGLMHWLLQRLREHDAANVDVGRLLKAATVGFNLAALQRLHQQLLAGQEGAVQAQPQELDQGQQGSILAAAAGSPTPDWQAKIEWLEGLGYPRTDEACVKAAQRPADTAARLQWLCSRGYRLSPQAANQAAKRGDLASLRFMMEEQLGGRTIGGASIRAAAAGGHLTVLQDLHARGVPMDASEVACEAAEGGHLPVVVWVMETLGGVDPDTTPDLSSCAARGGSIQLMSWLQGRGWGWEDDTIECATDRGGCEEVLEWLVEQGCPIAADGVPYMVAARNWDLATLRCLHRLGCPWVPNILEGCIRSEYPVPVLRCFVELGCPVNWDAASRTAETCTSVGYRTAVLAWLGEERPQQ